MPGLDGGSLESVLMYVSICRDNANYRLFNWESYPLSPMIDQPRESLYAKLSVNCGRELRELQPTV